MHHGFSNFEAPATIAWKASFTDVFLTGVVQSVDVSRNPAGFFHNDTSRVGTLQDLHEYFSSFRIIEALAATLNSCDQVCLAAVKNTGVTP